MGNILVMGSADFSGKALAKVNFDLDIIKTKFGCNCLGSFSSQANWSIRVGGYYVEGGSYPTKVGVICVESIVGKTIQLYCTRLTLNGTGEYVRSYLFYTSDLGTLTIEDIPDLEFSGSGIDYPMTVVSLVDPDANVQQGPHLFETTVPVGAKYLLFPIPFYGDHVDENDVFVRLKDE